MTKFLAFLFLLPAILFADINQELNSFFDKFGASANVTGGSVYNGQKAGYVRWTHLAGQLLSQNLFTSDSSSPSTDREKGQERHRLLTTQETLLPPPMGGGRRLSGKLAGSL